ncbi:MAG: ArsR/SmtB family transcription factor [Phycisphaerales bacterium]
MKRPSPAISLHDRLAALSEPLRLRLCRILAGHELSVGEVSKVVQLPQSTVSRNLKVLSDAGWLEKRAEGTATLYRLVLDEVSPEARGLWVAVRVELERAGDAVHAEDDRRVETVLLERRTDSVSFFGRVGGEWDALRGELFGGSFTALGLLGLLPREWVVADIGCGTGNAAELLAPYLREVVAVDQSGPMLDAARMRLKDVKNVRFADGPIEALPLGDSSVDAAVCVLVLHHVRELADGMGELFRVVRTGGRLLVIDMFEHDRETYRHTMGHAHLGFSAERMKELMEAAGFRNVRITPIRGDAEAKGPGLFAAVGEKS